MLLAGIPADCESWFQGHWLMAVMKSATRWAATLTVGGGALLMSLEAFRCVRALKARLGESRTDNAECAQDDGCRMQNAGGAVRRMTTVGASGAPGRGPSQ